jgi:general secretion pathway protein G
MKKLLLIFITLTLSLFLSCQNQEENILKAKETLKEFEVALEKFIEYHNRYPTSEEGLEGLIKYGGYLKGKKVPLDPWNNSYQYVSENEYKYSIKSVGPDGQEGGEGLDADIIVIKENKDKEKEIKQKAEPKKKKKKTKRSSKKRKRRGKKRRR